MLIKYIVPVNIGNVNNNIIIIIKILYGNNVIIFNVIEYDLIFIFIIQKLIDVRYDDIPDINNIYIRERIFEGDKDINEIDNGGYNVHPISDPNSINIYIII